MANRLRGLVRSRIAMLSAAAIVIAAAAVVIAGWENRPTLESMGIAHPTNDAIPVYEGVEWQPDGMAADGEGFVPAAENGRFRLLLEPVSSRIAVVDLSTGYMWRSNPSRQALEKETVKGALLGNLQSPFIMEYVSGNASKRSLKNTEDPKLSIRYAQIGDEGVQATYAYEDLDIQFVMQYKLTDRGLQVLIPSSGIAEEGEHGLYSINPLPFFGAVPLAEEEGYLFVPDGPGGLVYFNERKRSTASSFDFPVYGRDPASVQNVDDRRSPTEGQAHYPVFGLKREGHAFAAVIGEGQYSAAVRAGLPGNISSYNTVSALFSYREEFGRRVSGITDEVVISVEKDRRRHDRMVEYVLLSGDEADYNGMAAGYRTYLEENGLLGDGLAPVGDVPLSLTFLGGGKKPSFGGRRFEPATTFRQAQSIVEDLMARGVRNIEVTYQGWQDSGYPYADERFPVAEELGGSDGAKAFIARMHELGVKVFFEDYIGWKNDALSAFSMKSDGIRAIDSTVLHLEAGDSNYFILNPVTAIRGQKKVIDRLKKLGVDGIHYEDGPGNLLFSDFNPGAPLSREETAHYYGELLRYTAEELGGVIVTEGYQYTLKHAATAAELPYEESYNMFVDETIPFYQMALHGKVKYTAAPGNLREDYGQDRLRAIAYGAVPAFRLTYEPSRTMKDTAYDDAYSSQYEVWRERILQEYEKFNRLAALYHQRFVSFERQGAILQSRYEDGTTVTVDMETGQLDVKEGA
ncbi:DUF5696 domain-containing protein [Paenibacillus sp. J5C_2022]|uniref:DUF5696 domain-containing protein n=1 Tax=Paenibacillus sp. J5C2022 TaxID=2977129 RepID=UPI0021CE91DC|nr:DUF5696 domain-containing protein [Paenibacillus sp. J5C2022]MCU6711599.1 DUF5696 domain-containing protein [Paenibacillus sp. J5C2022]